MILTCLQNSDSRYGYAPPRYIIEDMNSLIILGVKYHLKSSTIYKLWLDGDGIMQG